MELNKLTINHIITIIIIILFSQKLDLQESSSSKDMFSQ